MKKLVLSLVVPLFFCGCIDRDYDLSEVDSDNIAIGGDASEFRFPLATIVVGVRDLRADASDVRAVFEEVDVWVPSTLPGNAEYVDIVRLSDDGVYLDAMLNALVEEMRSPGSKKMDEVVDLIWRDPAYRHRFAALIPSDSEELFKTAFREAFVRQNEIGVQLRQTILVMAREFLEDIRIDPVSYTADLGLSDDVVDMLSENIDPEGTFDPVNTLSLYGEVVCGLPVSFTLSPVFSGANVAVTPFLIEPNKMVDVPETMLFREDARSMLDAFSLDMSFVPQRYYPRSWDDGGQTIRLTLHLKKRGGLSMNL